MCHVTDRVYVRPNTLENWIFGICFRAWILFDPPRGYSLLEEVGHLKQFLFENFILTCFLDEKLLHKANAVIRAFDCVDRLHGLPVASDWFSAYHLGQVEAARCCLLGACHAKGERELQKNFFLSSSPVRFWIFGDTFMNFWRYVFDFLEIRFWFFGNTFLKFWRYVYEFLGICFLNFWERLLNFDVHDFLENWKFWIMFWKIWNMFFENFVLEKFR